jgi:hypothetical protein
MVSKGTRVGRRIGAGVGLLLVVLVVLWKLAASGVLGASAVPEALLASSVDQRQTNIEKAFALPVASRYGANLYWQSNGSYCGPASLVNVWRSFGYRVLDEGRVLQGSGKCRFGLCLMGLTLDELAGVAGGREGHTVTVARNLSPDDFLAHLRKSNDPARRVIINFSRKPIFGQGGGHHSPIGGYLEAEDLVLVLDVNQNYRPWLISRARLFAAMDTFDGAHKRGLIVIDKTDE